MHIPSFLWIALCLVVDTSSKSVRSTYNETGVNGTSLDNLQVVEECDCGPEASDCTLSVDGDKTCSCKPNFAYKDGICEECLCGDNAEECSFKDNGDKICKCKDKFVQKGDICEECDCGPEASDCTLSVDGDKICSCKPNFAYKDGICEECSCGENAEGCSFKDNGEKICKCKAKFAQNGDACAVCSCGTNMESCRYDERGNKLCSCPEGYIDINGQCYKIPLPSTVGPIDITSNSPRISTVDYSSDFTNFNGTFDPYSTTARPPDAKVDPYVIILIAASVFSSVVLIFVTCVMCQRYRKRAS